MKTVFQNLKRRGLAVKLSLSIFIGTTLIVAVSFAYEYWYSSRLVLQNVEADAGNLAQATVNEVETVLNGITKVVMFTASYLEHHDYTEEDVLRIIRHFVSSSDEIYGAAIAYEPYAHDPGQRDFAPYYYKKNGKLTATDLSATGWSMGTVLLEDELFADIHALNRQVILIALGGFAILLVVIFTITNRMVRPLETLASTTTEIAKGNLDIELPHVSSRDEVGDLSRAFEDMRVSLKQYISNLAETIKAKERLDSELKIAQNIQMNFLPKRFPPFPDKPEFQIYAQLEPAKYVGGDLYDFFLLDDNKLFVSIGDVADKGVPAALFMAMTKTLMKGVAEQEPGPAEILMRVNNEIARDNDTSMFVTLICGILNLETGELIYSNAGHNPPVLIRNNQAPEWLDIPEGFILGPIMDTLYINNRITLNPGDLLLLYTDGVNEAMNEKRVIYSNKRLIDTVTARKSDSAEDLVHLVMESVEDYSGDQEQSDDITILALRYDGRDESNNTV